MITDELLFRYLNQETSKSENRKIESWLSEYPDQIHRLNELRHLFNIQAQPDDLEQALQSWNTLESGMKDEAPVIHKGSVLPIRLARIAAVLLVLTGTVMLWYFQSSNQVIRNTGQYAKSLFLPDGTHVDLGPGAKLTLGKDFSDSVREIKLSGEAHFDVAPDPGHPFIVIAGPARIKVTGTRFVVNASPKNEEVEVTVKSGIVLFYNSDTMNKNSFRMDLAAGEKGFFSPALNRMDKSRDPYYQSTP